MESGRKPIKKLYYSIGEVSKITSLKQYVLRYWETEFSHLGPNKNKSGNRIYRQKDIDLIMQIKDLLYTRKFTIEGARHQLAGEIKSTEEVLTNPQTMTDNPSGSKAGVDKKILIKIRDELKALLDNLNEY